MSGSTDSHRVLDAVMIFLSLTAGFIISMRLNDRDSDRVSAGAVAAATDSNLVFQAGKKLCSPIILPAPSRIYFPLIALRLAEYNAGLRSSGAPISGSVTKFRYAEIGCRRCHYTMEVLAMYKALAPDLEVEAYCIDSWGRRPGAEPGVADNNDEIQGQRNLGMCNATVGRVPGMHFVRGLSVPSASQFSDEYFDAVYIDALHTYDAAYADMVAWWPKVKKGGFFSGDDFGDKKLNWQQPFYAELYSFFEWGVVSAVGDFQKNHSIDFFQTHQNPKYVERLKYPSRGFPVDWFAVKPSPAFDPDCASVITSGEELRDPPRLGRLIDKRTGTLFTDAEWKLAFSVPMD